MQKFTRRKNKHTQDQTQLARELTITSQKIHQEQKKIFQIKTKGQRVMKEETVWHKTKSAKLAIPQNIKLKNAKRREIY